MCIVTAMLTIVSAFLGCASLYIYQHTGSMFEAGGVAIAALVPLAFLLSILKGRDGETPRTNRVHSAARIVKDKQHGTRIEVCNLDAGQASDLCRNVHFSNITAITNDGDGLYYWSFQKEADDEEIRDVLRVINTKLIDINQAKDKSY